MGLRAVTAKRETRSPNLNRSSLISLIEDTINESKLLDISTKLDGLSFACLAFKDWGSTPIAHYNMHFVTGQPNEMLNKLGIFFMTSLGQGDSYYEGLYGPLPVNGYKEHLAYLYGFSVNDTSINDERAENIAYTILIIFFPRYLVSYLQSAFKIISKVLTRTFSDIKDVKELTLPLLCNIKDELKFSIEYWHFLSL
ncbi:MAG: hypothetical protein ACFFC7_25785 [Candidatus Hermodarchaeota archaeon]